MKKLYIIILLAFIGLSSSAQVVYIPDTSFKKALLADTLINTNKDTSIQVSEALAYGATISVHGLGIKDMTGIEAFTAIRSLDCSTNSITSLNVSANMALRSLGCNFNNLTSLDVSGNVQLNYIQCSNNKLTALDASSNILITSLYCDHNNLTSLNVKNGNNQNMPGTNFYANNNTGLLCIEVDSPAYSTTNWTHKDSWTSYKTSCAPLSVGEIADLADINIYPNPVATELIIETNGQKAEFLKLYNVLGEIVFSCCPTNMRTVINMNIVPAGIYFIQITDADKNIINRKVIKQY